MPDDPAALTRFEWRVRRAEFVLTFARWTDRAWLMFGMAAATLALLSLRTGDLPLDDRIVVAALSALTGFAAARAFRTRLNVLSEESAAAVSALDPRSRRAYEILGHGMALVALLLVTLLARPAVAGVGAVGFLSGALVARLTPSVVEYPTLSPPLQRLERARRVLARRGSAGGVAALGVLLLLPLASGPPWSVAALLIVGLVLMPMDAKAVRFEAEAGLSTGKSLDRHLRAAGVLLVAVPVAAAFVAPALAPALALAAAALIGISAVRLLLYRTRAKRGADLILGVGVGVAGLLAITAPPLAIALAAVALVRLVKASEDARWRLAG